MFPEPLSEVFRRGFNICSIWPRSDCHDPFQWILVSGLVLFVMNESQHFGFMGSPVGPKYFEKPFCIAIL
jgi:hypothetical protein